MNERIIKIKSLREKGLTYQAIGDIYNISRQRVQQIIKNTYYPSKKRIQRRLLRILKLRKKILLFKENKTKISLNKDVFYINQNGRTPKGLPNFSISSITGMKTGSRDRVRELVRIRDNHTCQSCGKKWEEGKRRFDIHHTDENIIGIINTRELAIQYDRENMDKLITLCHYCHLNLHWGHITL